MFTYTVGFTPGENFSELGEGGEFMWHHFHVKDRGVQDFEGRRTVALQNSTGCAVPLTWLLLDSQSTVDLIANDNMLVNICTVQDKDAIHVHCNSWVNIVDKIGNLPRYRTVCYKATGISNILSMSRVTRKFRVVFESEGGNSFRVVLLDREVGFQLIPNRI